MLPYFKRSEDNERGEDAFHGAGGPMQVSDSRSMHPLVDTMLEAARQAGHEHNPDFNGARQEGVGRFQLTQRDGLALRAPPTPSCDPRAERPNLRRAHRARWRCGSCSRATARSASRCRATDERDRRSAPSAR